MGSPDLDALPAGHRRRPEMAGSTNRPGRFPRDYPKSQRSSPSLPSARQEQWGPKPSFPELRRPVPPPMGVPSHLSPEPTPEGGSPSHHSPPNDPRRVPSATQSPQPASQPPKGSFGRHSPRNDPRRASPVTTAREPTPEGGSPSHHSPPNDPRRVPSATQSPQPRTDPEGLPQSPQPRTDPRRAPSVTTAPDRPPKGSLGHRRQRQGPPRRSHPCGSRACPTRQCAQASLPSDWNAAEPRGRQGLGPSSHQCLATVAYPSEADPCQGAPTGPVFPPHAPPSPGDLLAASPQHPVGSAEPSADSPIPSRTPAWLSQTPSDGSGGAHPLPAPPAPEDRVISKQEMGNLKFTLMDDGGMEDCEQNPPQENLNSCAGALQPVGGAERCGVRVRKQSSAAGSVSPARLAGGDPVVWKPKKSERP
ncbi:proline-rich protein 2-like [Ochotona curzoniae]|uniref:proline-rich protein 2-like n=1 Tax=Ochotona curzoniae TaxID=130825 RepID=UPI001B350CD2|nr:proline-rich protein 2-like [Ochotona curzoniae]